MTGKETTLTPVQRATFKTNIERTMESGRQMLRALGFAADAEPEPATGTCPHCGKDLDVKPDEPKDDEPAKDEPAADQAKEPAADAFGWGKVIARANAGQIVATKEA